MQPLIYESKERTMSGQYLIVRSFFQIIPRIQAKQNIDIEIQTIDKLKLYYHSR